jgi:hypothetical protein
MQDTQPPSMASAASPFGLSGEQYWLKPMDQPGPLAYGSDLLRKDSKAQGIHIDVPPKVLLDKHKTVPLIAFNSNSTADVSRFGLKRTAQIVLAQLETGTITMTKAAESPLPDPDRPEPGPGWVVEDLETDAAEAGLGPRLGRYAVCLLNGPDGSETRTFTVFPSAAAEHAVETGTALKALRHEGGAPPLASAKRLHLRHEPLPQLPQGAMPFTLAADPAGGHRVHLGFRLAALPRFIHPKDKPVLDDEGKRVFATLPVFLVAFDADRLPVHSQLLGLPIAAGPGGDPESPNLTGHVSFDLETLIQAKPGAKLTLWALAMDRKAKLDLAW